MPSKQKYKYKCWKFYVYPQHEGYMILTARLVSSHDFSKFFANANPSVYKIDGTWGDSQIKRGILFWISCEQYLPATEATDKNIKKLIIEIRELSRLRFALKIDCVTGATRKRPRPRAGGTVGEELSYNLACERRD